MPRPYGKPTTPPPNPDPSITPSTMHGNYPSKPMECATDREWPFWDGNIILRFIDWLNALCGAAKPKGKRKETDEQMATLADLFDEVEKNRP